MLTIDLLKDGSEVVHYDEPGIPVYIKLGTILSFPEGKVIPHWHEDIEFSCVLEGSMGYEINGKRTVVNEGDCMFINASQIHRNYSLDGKDCRYICVLLHPSLLAGSQAIFEKTVRPVLEHRGIEYIQYERSDRGHEEIRRLIRSLYAMSLKKTDTYEISVISKFCSLWEILYGDLKPMLKTRSEQTDPDLLLLRKMIIFIYRDFQKQLTLDEIAGSADVSRSKACRLFRRYIEITPVEFLNDYRLKVSADMLAESDKKISGIAMDCGFSSFSYYSGRFREKYGVTPREYREKSRSA